jgi:hypothetical protein
MICDFAHNTCESKSEILGPAKLNILKRDSLLAGSFSHSLPSVAWRVNIFTVLWVLLGAMPFAQQPGPSAVAVTSGTQAVALPVVARPMPSQPPVGAPGDPHLNKTPVRQTVGLDLVKMGWSYNCNECHQMIKPRWRYDRPMAEHQEIRLDHGNNRFCLNCHHPSDRTAFADYDGSEIAEKDVVLLCAKCHGTIYRDWQAGVHGRANGYWDATRGPQTRLKCIQCHDPHSPQFKPLKPLSPPHYPVRAYRADDAPTER